MIIRQWRGFAAIEESDEYVDHFRRIVLPDLNRMQGYHEAYLLRRNLEDGIEFSVLTLWESMDAIRRFAGENTEMAVIAPEAEALLRAFDTTATHYEIVIDR